MPSDNSLAIDSIDVGFLSEMSAGKQLDDVDIAKRRTPKRILHFCDGTLEEYSTEEEEEKTALLEKKNSVMDPNSLSWGPWIRYQTIEASVRLLALCDYLGESLAHFFGILSPKYEYEIEHYKRLMAEDEDLKRQQDIEMAGWGSPKEKHIIVDSEFRRKPHNRLVGVEGRF